MRKISNTHKLAIERKIKILNAVTKEKYFIEYRKTEIDLLRETKDLPEFIHAFLEIDNLYYYILGIIEYKYNERNY